jgi:hypothetical protein
MADDPVEAARRRQQRMLSRSSYFAAANLRQFEGTELSPPGAGTYYKPGGAYAGTPRAQRALAQAWQSDLAFNAQANPRIAQGLEAERIGAQYGGRSQFGQPGYTTINLPSGGTTTVRNREAARIAALPGYSVFDPSKIQSQGFAQGFGSTSTPQVVSGAGGNNLNRGGVQTPIENLSPAERLQYSPTVGQRLQESAYSGFARLGTLGYNAMASLGGLFQGQNMANRGMSGQLGQRDQNYFAYNPSPAPPRRYFDF